MKVLFVCTGNSCRSPMAEGLMEKAAEERGQDIICASAGLFPDSIKASDNAIAVMANRGIDISSHIPSGITPQIVEEADLILTMTPAHKDVLLQLDAAKGKTYTICEYAGCANGSVSDPYGGDITVYEKCASELEEFVKRVCEKVGK